MVKGGHKVKYRLSLKGLDSLAITFTFVNTLLLGSFYSLSFLVYERVQWKFSYRLFEEGYGYGLFLDMLLCWTMTILSMVLLHRYASFIVLYYGTTRFNGKNLAYFEAHNDFYLIDTFNNKGIKICYTEDITKLDIIETNNETVFVRMVFNKGTVTYNTVGRTLITAIDLTNLDKFTMPLKDVRKVRKRSRLLYSIYCYRVGLVSGEGLRKLVREAR